MNYWENEDLVKKYGPALLAGGGVAPDPNSLNFNIGGAPTPSIIDLANFGKSGGAPSFENMPTKPVATPSGWGGALDSTLDMDAINKQAIEANQPVSASGTTQPAKEPSKWDKFKGFLKQALPVGLMLMSGGFSAPMAIGASMLAYKDNEEKRKATEYQRALDEREYQDQRNDLNYNRQYQLQADAENLRRWTEEQNYKAMRDKTGDNQWNRTYQLNVDNAEAADQRAKNELDSQNYWKRQEYGLERDRLALAEEKQNSNETPRPSDRDLASRHLKEIDAMVYRYKRPSDYVADLKRYEPELVRRFGRKSYDEMFKLAKRRIGKNAENRNYKPGSTSPMRYYIQAAMDKNLW